MGARRIAAGCAWLALTTWTVGCGGGGGDAPPASEPPADTPSTDTAAAEPVQTEGRAAGIFTLGADTRDFEPCEGGSAWWVDGPALPDLIALHAEMTPGQEPYESIFMDALARIEPPPSSGAGSSLDGTLYVMELRRAAFEGYGCRAVDQDLLARGGGNEPFWTVEIYEDQATFSTPDGERPLDAGPLEPSPDGWRVAGTVQGGGDFELILAIGGCADSMSGAWSHAFATLTIEGETYEGCGFLGAAAELS